MALLALTRAVPAGGVWLLLGQLVAARLASPAQARNALGQPCSRHGEQCWTPIQVRHLHQKRFCNGHQDCPDGADESVEACQHPWALPAPPCPCLFQCGVGAECFPSAWVCDGHADCEDGQDELECSSESPEASLGSSTAQTGVGCGQTECVTETVGEAGTENPAITKSEKSALSETRGPLWVTAALVLLSVLMIAGCTVSRGRFRAKNKCSTFSLETAVREQLEPDRGHLVSSP